MARKWIVEMGELNGGSGADSRTSRDQDSRRGIVYTPVSTSRARWPKKNKTNLIITGCIVVVCIIIALYFILRDSGGRRPPRGLVPPDPEEPLPPSYSNLHVFKRGAVCTDGPPCSSIGRDILLKNGSAVDATIAAMFCNGFVNMQSMGIGGGFLMTIYVRETRQAFTLNAREVAPLKATQDMFKDNPKAATSGPLSMAVPGELRGYWEAHKKFGKLPWKTLIEPSLELCKTGYNVSKAQYDSIVSIEDKVKIDPNLREMFYDELKKKLKPRNSLIMPSKAMCQTMRIIADTDGDALHNGSLTDAFAKDLRDLGSIITKEDLANYRPVWKDPIKVSLPKGDELFSIPPPGSGALLGFALNILAGYKFNKDSIGDINSTILTYHRIVEAFKYTYAKRSLLGDADYVDVKQLVSNLTSPAYAESIRNLINDSATYTNSSHYGAHFYTQPDHGTAHISVIAQNGDAVSVTSTINYYFGGGLTTKETGIVLNNAMDDFSSPGFVNAFGVPSSPANFIEPGKRPLSSMCPSVIVDDKGEVKMVIGASGATKITTAVALVIMRKLWFDQTIKEAVDAPRIHHQLLPMTVSYEYGNLKQVVDNLKTLGHNMTRYGDRGSIICALYRNKTAIYANADYRKGGDVFGMD